MSAQTPNSKVAIGFLRQLRPDGPWAITAIEPDRPAITTRTFGPESVEELLAFLAEHNGRRNLYYALNLPAQAANKKAKKKDIARVEFLHVDIDARAGEPLADELGRIRALAHGVPPEGVPPPTYIIMSGGGYQLLWQLAEPIPISGDLAAAAEVERYNRELERVYAADACHNVDRILRLPGTVNIPNAKKRAKGRVEALAELSASYPDRVHPISKFRQAAASAPSGGDQSGVTPCAPARGGVGGVARVSDLSELNKWGVPDRVKVIINQGCHPDEPKENDNSRSAWLFDACCQMVRHDVPVEVILGVITDPVWAISESVLEHKGRADSYARQQIEKARATVAGDATDFEVNKDGVPYPNQNNIRVALRRLGARLSHDQFADRLMVEGLPGHGPTLQDEGVAALYLRTDEQFHFRPSKEFFWMVVEDEARRHGHHPVRDYIDRLVWDKTPRIDQWLVTYGGAEDTPYTRAVGALVLLAAVRRVRQPGCKFDEMLVLRSPQGSDKSSALAALCPDPAWFTDDLPLGADTKVVIERLQGRWIVEAAELKGMRHGDVEHLKAFLSRQVDRARMAYGRIPKEVPRQCVIVGTTNSERFLKDTTGNRRFWPVQVGQFDVAGLRLDRDQLWAEAARREAAGESIRLDPALYSAATEAQENHRIEDPFVEMLTAVLGDMRGKLRAADAWEIVGVPSGQRTQDHNARLGDAMRELGWQQTKLRFGGPVPCRCYARGTKAERGRRVTVYRDSQGHVRAEYERSREAF